MSSCTTCGSPNLPSATACAFCGNVLAAAQPVAVAAARAPASGPMVPRWEPPPPPPPPPPPGLDFFAQAQPVSTWSLPVQPLRRPPSRQGMPVWGWVVVAALVCGVGAFLTVLMMGHTVKKSVETAISARNQAQERAAQSNARNALTAEKVQYADEERYTADPSKLAQIEPRLQWVNGVATVAGQVSVAASGERLVVSAVAEDGLCFSIQDVNVSGAGFTAGTFYAEGTGPCDASRPPGEFLPVPWPPLSSTGGGDDDPGGAGGGGIRVPKIPTPATTLP